MFDTSLDLRPNKYLKLLLGKGLANFDEYQPNAIYYSEFKREYFKNTFLYFGLKYVAEGTEYYKIGNKEHKVNEKHFILTQSIPNVPGFVDSRKIVKGISLDIDHTIVNQAVSTLTATKPLDVDITLTNFVNYPFYFEHVSFSGSSKLKNRLEQLEKHLTAHDFEIPFVNEEWFYETAEEMVTEQLEKWNALTKIKVLKTCTKKEILKRLLLGKEYIDVNFTSNPAIKDISAFCGLSEFHFFRSFKSAFGLSPHQYVLKKKLDYSKELVLSGKLCITEISQLMNFTDVQAFSNAFKKHFGIPPSRLYK